MKLHLKYISIFLFLAFNFSYCYQPTYHSYENIDSLDLDSFELTLDSIELYVYSEIYLHSNTISLDDIRIMNRTEKDIFVFWNSFVFQNLINEDSVNLKKTAFMNELTIYKKGSLKTPKYIDSVSNSVPVFIKLPKISEYKKSPHNKGQNIELFFEDINQFISLKDRRTIELKITVNFIDSDDVELLKDKFGIDISERAIIPLDTRISTYSRLENSFGYVNCFNSPVTDKNLVEFNKILKSKIKKLIVVARPAILEFDPYRN